MCARGGRRIETVCECARERESASESVQEATGRVRGDDSNEASECVRVSAVTCQWQARQKTTAARDSVYCACACPVSLVHSIVCLDSLAVEVAVDAIDVDAEGSVRCLAQASDRGALV